MNFTNKHTLVCCLVCLRKVPVKVAELPHLGGTGRQGLCGQFLNFCCQYLKVDVSNFNKGDEGDEGGGEIEIEPIGVNHLYSFIFSGVDDDDKDKVFCPQCYQIITELMGRYEEWMNVKARLLSSIRKLEGVLEEGTIKKRKARKRVAAFRNDIQQKCYNKTSGINPVVQVHKMTVTLPPSRLLTTRSRPQVLRDLECEMEFKTDVDNEAIAWSPYSDSISATQDWIGPTLSPPRQPEPPTTVDNELDIKPELELPNEKRRRPPTKRKLFKRLSSSIKVKSRESAAKPVQRLTKRKEAHNCPQCDSKFKWKHILYQHQAIEHENIKNFLKCETCGKKMRNIRMLLNHIQDKHENPEDINVYCPYCPESFTTQQLSLLHRRCMHSVYGRSPELFCEVENCYEKFLHVSDMNQHLTTAHLHSSEMGKLYSCDLCGLEFLHPTRCRLHQFIHYEKDVDDFYKCPQYVECGVKFKKVRNVMNHFHQSHISPEHQVQVHRCSLCKTNCYFFSKNDLESHLKTHLIEVKCGLCGKVFQGHNELTAHRYLEHPEHPVVKKVQGLKKDRNTNRELEKTFYTDKTTEGEQTYLTRRCGHCSKTFSTITELQKHKLKMHRVGSTFTRIVCEHCGKSVPKDVFPKHLLIHSALQVECPYQCGKKFPNAMQAHRHAKKMHERTIVPPPQDFVCEVCGKKYLTRSLINRHWKLVHEEKRYLCKVCGKRCGTITTFKEHVMAKHSDDKITCQWCSTRFNGANPDRDLLNHVKKSHTPEMLREHMAKRRSWRYEMNVDKYLELTGGDDEKGGSSGCGNTVKGNTPSNDKTDERNDDSFQLPQAAVTSNSNWQTPNEFSEYILP